MLKIYVPEGLQASGKSTLGRDISEETGAVIISIDDVRNEVLPKAGKIWSPYHGKGREVQEEWERRVIWTLEKEKKSVYADRTNLTPEGKIRIALLAKGRAEVIRGGRLDLRWVPPEVCIARDALRPEKTRVGPEPIWDLFNRYIVWKEQ